MNKISTQPMNYIYVVAKYSSTLIIRIKAKIIVSLNLHSYTLNVLKSRDGKETIIK